MQIADQHAPRHKGLKLRGLAFRGVRCKAMGLEADALMLASRAGTWRNGIASCFAREKRWVQILAFPHAQSFRNFLYCGACGFCSSCAPVQLPNTSEQQEGKGGLQVGRESPQCAEWKRVPRNGCATPMRFCLQGPKTNTYPGNCPQRTGAANFLKKVCPSGLREWTQVPVAQAAWVQIPQLSFSFPCCLNPVLPVLCFIARSGVR